MGHLKIKTMTNQDPGFYETVGPFLSRREVVAETGAPIWDDDGKAWFVAYSGRKVVGLAATRCVGKHVALVSAFVRPEHRGSGVYRSLISARIASTHEPLKAVATPAAVAALKQAGLKKTGQRGKYTILERA